jgi:hypothetical protein
MTDQIENALRREPTDIPSSLPALVLRERAQGQVSLVRRRGPVGAVLVAAMAVALVVGVRVATTALNFGRPEATPASSLQQLVPHSPAGSQPSGKPSATAGRDTWQFVEGGTTKWPVTVTLRDESGLVTSARGIAPFEFIPAPEKPGATYAFNNADGSRSEHVGIIWFGSHCDGATTVTIDSLARAVTITRTADHPCTMELRTPIVRGIVLEFSRPIDAREIKVTLRP